MSAQPIMNPYSGIFGFRRVRNRKAFHLLVARIYHWLSSKSLLIDINLLGDIFYC